MDIVTRQAGSKAPSPLADADLRLMLLIRHAEWKLLECYQQNLISGTTHTCLGQEYVPVALRPLLRSATTSCSATIAGTATTSPATTIRTACSPRSWAARARCAAASAAASTSSATATCRPASRGESLPVAVGVALHLKRHEPGRLACAYIGDGTWGEGAVYEALNMAALWRLPLLVVVENNGIAQSTPTAGSWPAPSPGARRRSASRTTGPTSTDLDEIRDELAPLVERRSAAPAAPLVVEFATGRLGPHSKGDDTRTAAELAAARERDWYPRYAAAFPEQFGRPRRGGQRRWSTRSYRRGRRPGRRRRWAVTA